MNESEKADIAAEPHPEVDPSAVQAILQQSDELHLEKNQKRLRCREDVFVPLVHDSGRFIVLKRKHEKFLEALRPGVSLEAAALSAGMDEQQAMRFLRRKDIRRWMHDIAKRVAIRRGWPERWWDEVTAIYEGKKVLSPMQAQALEWIGERVAPKPSRNAPTHSETKIEINIDPGAVDRALLRQKSIEGRIINAA